jgi:hypothetical protein
VTTHRAAEAAVASQKPFLQVDQRLVPADLMVISIDPELAAAA